MAGKRNPRKLGRLGEKLAKTFLEASGYEVLFRNVRTEYGEIDLIAKRKNRLHFVEVKTRRSKTFGTPEDSITPKKLGHMVNSAEAFFQTYPEYEGDWQIDVIAILLKTDTTSPEIRLFENVS